MLSHIPPVIGSIGTPTWVLAAYNHWLNKSWLLAPRNITKPRHVTALRFSALVECCHSSLTTSPRPYCATHLSSSLRIESRKIWSSLQLFRKKEKHCIYGGLVLLYHTCSSGLNLKKSQLCLGNKVCKHFFVLIVS